MIDVRRPNPEDSREGSPFGLSWPALYTVVLAALLFEILLFGLFTAAFR